MLPRPGGYFLPFPALGRIVPLARPCFLSHGRRYLFDREYAGPRSRAGSFNHSHHYSLGREYAPGEKIRRVRHGSWRNIRSGAAFTRSPAAMCTLSIYQARRRCVVTMNRDEARSRNEPGVLRDGRAGDIRFSYPLDGQSGGSWIGVNDRGIVLCLLNRYHAARAAARTPRSRGIIIPRALARGAFDAVDASLQELDGRPFNPFDVFLAGGGRIKHFSWDGGSYGIEDVKAGRWYLFTSSGFRAEEVIAYRRGVFRDWCSRVKEKGAAALDPQEILRGFHLVQTTGMETHSVLMARENTHTKSVVQVDVQGRELSLKYYPRILPGESGRPVIKTLEINV